MKTNPNNKRRFQGLSLIEVLVVLAILFIFAGMLLPSLSHKGGRAVRVACVNNLKQVSTGLRLWANDHDSKYPFDYVSSSSPTNFLSPMPEGWSKHPTNLWKLFQLAQSDLSSPRILVCPSDKDRRPAEDFMAGTDATKNSFSHPSKRNNALSYFLALDAKEARPAMLLAGDRNLALDPTKSDQEPGRNYLTGEQRLGSTAEETKHLRWNTDIHDRGGNVAFMDGSVQQLTSGRLRQAVMNTGDTTNRIWLPQ